MGGERFETRNRKRQRRDVLLRVDRKYVGRKFSTKKKSRSSKEKRIESSKTASPRNISDGKKLLLQPTMANVVQSIPS